MNKEKLVDAWVKNKDDEFKEVYVKVLEEATHHRGTTNPDAKHIQTMFYPPLLSHYKMSHSDWKHHVMNSDLPDTIHENYLNFTSNAEEVKQTKLSFPKQTFEELEMSLQTMNRTDHAFLGHRNGQAFVALPLTPDTDHTTDHSNSNNELLFLLLDDHFPIARTVDIPDLLEYIKKVPHNTHQLFFWTTTARTSKPQILLAEEHISVL